MKKKIFILPSLLILFFSLSAQAQPTAPTNLVATAASSTVINLTWTDRSNNETGFQVQRSATGGGAGFTTIATTAANAVSFSNTGLTANTKFFYRIRSTNATGSSAFTAEVNATTLVAPPAAPTTLAATAISSTQINLTWVDASNNETGFQIERSLTGGGAGFALVTTTAANAVSFSNTGLTANTKFFYRVRATNAGGNSTFTAEVNATTLVAPPTAPTTLAATAISSTQINLTWVDASTTETGFQIERSATGGGTGFTLITTTAANATSFSNTGLTANTSFFYRVRAINAGGNSAFTTEATATTLVAPPATPTTLAAVAASSTQINLTWVDASTNETGFQIERSATGGGTGFTLVTTTAANATSFSNTGLTASAIFFYRVRAINAGGNSAFTTEATATTLVAPPTAPTTLAAVTASSTQINLTWVDASTNETGFQIERSTIGGGTGFTLVTTTAANAVSFSDASLSASTQYFYRVRAINAGGNSTFTAEATATTLIAPPVAPTTLAAVATSSSQINLTWVDASTNETGFQIERSLTGGGSGFTLVTTTTANVISLSDVGLAPNTPYFYRVRAVNAGGTSAYTTESSATTAPLPPIVPSNLIATVTSSVSINLSWNDASDNETGFLIERSVTSGSGYVLISTTLANATSFSDVGLTANTPYYYRIRSTNTGGNSPYTTEATATTAPLAPLGPSTLAAINVSPTSINLTWTDASDNETGFQIERSSPGNSAYTLITTTLNNVTSYSDIGLTAGTTYYYRIRAVNTGGNSPYSNEANAITALLPPLAPFSLNAVPESSTAINLSWSDASNNEAGFELERSLTTGSGFVLIYTASANSISFINSGLTPQTTYYYRIRAVNSGGNSAYSTEVSVTTPDSPPAPPTDLRAVASSQTSIDLSWTDKSTNETGFQVERSLTPDDGFILVATTEQNAITYTDNGLTAGNTYYYRLRAINGGGNTIYTPVTNATIFIDGVTQLCANLYCDANGGGIGVGTQIVPAGYKLAVKGKVMAEGVKVALQSEWPDYIFDKDHILIDISTLRKYITENGHLPNMPAAKTVQQEGIDMGSINVLLVEKIEELSLYLIQMEERINKLEAENKDLKSKN